MLLTEMPYMLGIFPFFYLRKLSIKGIKIIPVSLNYNQIILFENSTFKMPRKNLTEADYSLSVYHLKYSNTSQKAFKTQIRFPLNTGGKENIFKLPQICIYSGFSTHLGGSSF